MSTKSNQFFALNPIFPLMLYFGVIIWPSYFKILMFWNLSDSILNSNLFKKLRLQYDIFAVWGRLGLTLSRSELSRAWRDRRGQRNAPKIIDKSAVVCHLATEKWQTFVNTCMPMPAAILRHLGYVSWYNNSTSYLSVRPTVIWHIKIKI